MCPELKAGRKIVVNKRIPRERLKPSSSLVVTLIMGTMKAALDRRLDPRGKVASRSSLNITILDIEEVNECIPAANMNIVATFKEE